jgi:hypothetical protein
MNRQALGSMATILGWTASGAATLLLAVFDPGPAAAAPIPTGACCNKFLGCCEPEGACREVTSGDCNGIADVFEGNATTCAGLCATTTTLPGVGACCFSNGFCVTDTEEVCIVNEGIYQGDDTTCESAECPITTTTLPAFGACCFSNGGCVTDTPEVCSVNEGAYQGDGSTCENSECPIQTTTTTVSTSTTTLPEMVLCGDANDDMVITAPDALIALRRSVGTAKCVPQRCDYNGNGLVQSSDALLILKVSVGQNIEPQCPEGI